MWHLLNDFFIYTNLFSKSDFLSFSRAVRANRVLRQRYPRKIKEKAGNFINMFWLYPLRKFADNHIFKIYSIQYLVFYFDFVSNNACIKTWYDLRYFSYLYFEYKIFKFITGSVSQMWALGPHLGHGLLNLWAIDGIMSPGT